MGISHSPKGHIEVFVRAVAGTHLRLVAPQPTFDLEATADDLEATADDLAAADDLVEG